jgi:16S rRNA (uracil1498-N3)-methyltransferase
MNSLIIQDNEGWESGLIRLVGARATKIFGDHAFQEGQEIHVARFGGDKGIARVRQFSSAVIEAELVSTMQSLPLRPIDLVVGLSRPQTLKKVIQAATMTGVRSLHLVHTSTGEKSYLTSHILQPEHLREEVVASLEQIWEGRYPEISVHRSFRYFTSQHLPTLGCEQSCMKIVASPCGDVVASPQMGVVHEAMVIAVGSEAGWSDVELNTLRSQGFTLVGLGPRVVRVEVALLMLLGQSLLYRLGQ